jgi:hypothetical protein
MRSKYLMRRAIALLAVASASVFAFSTPAQAQAKVRNGMWAWDGSGDCMDVPRGDFRAGVQLIIRPCANTASQWFDLREDGHLVANAGRRNAKGVLLCVDTDGRVPYLQPCRPLMTGDRQWWHRDEFRYFQNNVRGPRTECIAPRMRGFGEVAELLVRACWDDSETQHKAWVPYPYGPTDRAYDNAAEAVARKAGRRPGHTVPTYDPERRTRFDANLEAYGPYVTITDRRTGYCLKPDSLLGVLITGNCGRTVHHFHWKDSLLRQVTQDSQGRRGVSGRCATIPLNEGGFITLQPCDGRQEQKWWMIKGQIQSSSAAAGRRCFDVQNESRAPGAYIIAWRCNTSRPGHQAFAIVTETRFVP